MDRKRGASRTNQLAAWITMTLLMTAIRGVYWICIRFYFEALAMKRAENFGWIEFEFCCANKKFEFKMKTFIFECRGGKTFYHRCLLASGWFESNGKFCSPTIVQAVIVHCMKKPVQDTLQKTNTPCGEHLRRRKWIINHFGYFLREASGLLERTNETQMRTKMNNCNSFTHQKF